jgi:hypothetical protein
MKDAQAIGKIIYEKVASAQHAIEARDTGGGGPSTSESGPVAKDDDVIDAEFEVKDAK